MHNNLLNWQNVFKYQNFMLLHFLIPLSILRNSINTFAIFVFIFLKDI